MGDILLALSIPVLTFAVGIHAACDSWWRRRHPAPPSPYTRDAARLAEQELLTRAEGIVDRAYASLGHLYVGPWDMRDRAAEEAGGVTAGAGASPDHGP
ncbi:hypothetical protein ABZS61_10785 [Streptomyces sp. NPDC005566]|uniref:hypothetical protein n=1 Tax=Streptomyces sp. NPDC005566 TaxID=3156886 RepID=UPI0033A04FC4